MSNKSETLASEARRLVLFYQLVCSKFDIITLYILINQSAVQLFS